ncbi:hypothetical protein JW859_09280 [bacterium]|nr:hypothetical protein [bacterium]
MIYRRVMIWWAGVLALVAALGGAYALYAGQQANNTPVPCMGIVAPPTIPHPTTKLVAATADPAKYLVPGQPLKVTAETNEPTDEAAITVQLLTTTEPVKYEGFWLADDGEEPDEEAGDGIWTGEHVWTSTEEGPLKITVVLNFEPGPNGEFYTNQLRELPELTITDNPPPEEETEPPVQAEEPEDG